MPDGVPRRASPHSRESLGEGEIKRRNDLHGQRIKALIILDYLGVIEARGKLGTFLRSVGDTGFLLTNIQASAAIPSRALAQAYETRVFIEVPTAGLAAKRRSSNDLKRIEECLTNMEEQYRLGSYEVCGKTRWNTIFHSLIIRAACNDLFNRIFDGIYHVIEEATAAIRTKLTQAYVAEGWLNRSKIGRAHV